MESWRYDQIYALETSIDHTGCVLCSLQSHSFCLSPNSSPHLLFWAVKLCLPLEEPFASLLITSSQSSFAAAKVNWFTFWYHVVKFFTSGHFWDIPPTSSCSAFIVFFLFNSLGTIVIMIQKSESKFWYSEIELIRNIQIQTLLGMGKWAIE